MPGLTIAEKILSQHTEGIARAGALIVADVDAVMASDTTAPLAIKAFEEMGGGRIWNPERCYFVIDHAAPAPNERIAALHTLMRNFAAEHGCPLYDAGAGICHQLMVEQGHVEPGMLFVGADSHTCTYGSLCAFATGVGSTDLAAVMHTGQIWMRVPQTIRIWVDGTLSPGLSAKDLTLAIVGRVGLSGATYHALEFAGPAIEQLTLSSRMTLANMAIEMGAKAGIVHPAGLDLPSEVTEGLLPDDDAVYLKTLRFDASSLLPQISRPHMPDQVTDLAEVVGTPVDVAFIGTCVNGRLEDLHAAAEVLEGKQIPATVRLMVAPASKEVFLEAMMDGTAQILTRAGATFLPSGCGPCVGTHNGVPGPQETVISTGNRNFRGRMGNPSASVYLASPTTVAASALAGHIIHPLTGGQ